MVRMVPGDHRYPSSFPAILIQIKPEKGDNPCRGVGKMIMDEGLTSSISEYIHIIYIFWTKREKI